MQMTDAEKKEALDRASAARDRGIVVETKPRKKHKRRSRAKVLSVTVVDGAGAADVARFR